MWLIAPAIRIEFIRWRVEKDWKILNENIMFWFCGTGLEPTRTFGVTFVILVLKWFEGALFGCHHIDGSFPWAPTTSTILVCHVYSGSLQPRTKLELLNYVKFLYFFACEEVHVPAPWQEAHYLHRLVELFKVFSFFCMWGRACSS
jgi:hypothetical protein